MLKLVCPISPVVRHAKKSPLQALDEEMARTRVDGEEGEGEERTVDPRLEQKSQVGNSF